MDNQDDPIRSFNQRECEELLKQLEDQWTIFGTSNQTAMPSIDSILSRTLQNINHASTTNEFRQAIGHVRHQVVELYLRLHGIGVFSSSECLKQRMHRLLQVVGFSAVIINCSHRVQQAIENNSAPTDLATSFFSFSTMINEDPQDMKTYQRLLVHLCCQAQLHNNRRYGDSVYEPLITSTGYNTHSWNLVCDIKTFVYRSCQKEHHYDEWKLLTDHPSYPRNAIAYLTDCEDHQFPRLVKDRSSFSYSNGIYMAETDTYVSYLSGQSSSIPSGLCCAKHFDQPFPEEYADAAGREWRSIPTPTLNTMLDSQDLTGPVADWMYVFLGRLLYDVGQKDNWWVFNFSRMSCFLTDSLILWSLWYVDVLFSKNEFGPWCPGLGVLMCPQAPVTR